MCWRTLAKPTVRRSVLSGAADRWTRHWCGLVPNTMVGRTSPQKAKVEAAVLLLHRNTSRQASTNLI
jgi:hypothetical protein